jgi:hypothetical protein
MMHRVAGRGPAPKLPGQRRRHGAPARGEWVDLAPLTQPVLGPPDRDWPENGRRAWRAWRRDSVTTQWTPADVHYAKELARRFDVLKPNEVRLRMDGLGLTPIGRRNLRLRSAADVPAASEQPTVKRLHLIDRDDAQREN